MTNRINPNPNYYSLAAKKRQQEVEERMALLNKIKEDADKHNICLLYTSPSPRD